MSSKSGHLYQCWATVCANITHIAYGASIGWLLIASLHFQTVNTHLGIDPIDDNELSWIISSLFLGGLTGTIFLSWMGDFFGKKHTLCTLAIAQFLSWFLYMFSTNATEMYISSVMSGFAGGGSLVLVPLFISEIAEDEIRGVLGSTTILFYHIGLLISFIAKYFLTAQVATYILISLPVIFVLSFVYFYDSPIQLQKEFHKEKALKSLQMYRGARHASQQHLPYYQQELMKFRNAIVDRNLTVKHFFTRSSVKAFFVSTVLLLIQMLCGTFILLNYANWFPIPFPDQLSTNLLAIIIGCCQVFGSLISTMLIEKSGRKCLLLVSLIGTAIGFICLGICSYEHFLPTETLNWLSFASYCLVSLFASLGVLPLPSVIVTEIMPERIRTMGTTICYSLIWFLTFILVKFNCVLLVGLMPFMLFTGCICFMSAVWFMMVLPQTNGKSYDEILILMER